MTDKHTPGPWNRAQIIHTKACRIGTDARPICDVLPFNGEPTPEDNANARLIAQAWTIPTLRAALEGVLENLDMDGPESADEPDDASVGWNGDGTEMSMTFGDIRRARAALALANEPADGGDDT